MAVKIYKGWSSYTPEPNDRNSFIIERGGHFIRDENGVDWYDLGNELSLQTGKYYVVVNEENNLVIGVSTDPWAFFPCNMIFCIFDELDEEVIKKPENFELKGKKLVQSTIYASVVLAHNLELEKVWVSSEIDALTDAEMFSTEGLDEIKERLLALRRYRYEISQVDPETNPTYKINRP